MSLSHLFTLLLIFSISYAADSNSANNSKKSENVNPNDVNLASVLNILNKLENKINILEKTKNDLELKLNDNFDILQKNILDKLEKYIDGKSDSSEKRIDSKIDELRKNLPDKVDIKAIGSKIDVLNKQQLSTIIKKSILSNKGSDKNMNATMYMSSVISDYSMEESFYYILYELKRMMPEIVTIIREQLDALSRNIADNLEEKVISKLANIQETIVTTKDILVDKFYTLENVLDFGINFVERSYPWLERTALKKLNDLEKSQRSILEKVNEYPSIMYGPCKTITVHGFDYQPISIDDNSFNHVTTGHDAYNSTIFVMSFALKAAEGGIIQLSPTKNIGANNVFIALDIGIFTTTIHKSTFTDDNKMGLTNSLLWEYTPKSLSATKYMPFNIKIHDGTLEVTTPDHESEPLVRYSDKILRNIKYIGFTTRHDMVATFMYDCPF